MGQNKERFLFDRLKTGVGNGFRFHHAIDTGHPALFALGHVRAHGLRAQDRHLDPVITIGQGKPFREPDRRVFCHRIGGRPNLT